MRAGWTLGMLSECETWVGVQDIKVYIEKCNLILFLERSQNSSVVPQVKHLC